MARRAAALIAFGMVALPAGAAAQEPTVKPTSVRVTSPRLPAPQQVEVQQTGDAELTVTWQPVRGAKAYNLGRAVGTNGFQRVADGIGLQQARYVDRSLQPGVRVVYSITPIDSADVSGLRAISEPFESWRAAAPVGGGSTGGTGSTATTLDAPHVTLHVEGTTIRAVWPSVPGAVRYVIRLVGSRPSEQTVVDTRSGTQVATFTALLPGNYVTESVAISARDPFTGRSRTSSMRRSAPVSVLYAATDSAATAAEPPADAPATVNVPSQVISPSDSALTLRVSGRVRLSTEGVSRWVSLAPSVVSVASDGTVSALAAGSATVLGYGGVAGGVRVTVVEVVVSP